jgi:hypothetical protein
VSVGSQRERSRLLVEWARCSERAGQSRLAWKSCRSVRVHVGVHGWVHTWSGAELAVLCGVRSVELAVLSGGAGCALGVRMDRGMGVRMDQQ